MVNAQIDWRLERGMKMDEKEKGKQGKYCKRRFGNVCDCLVVMKFGYKLT